jgi:hypothetical protein
MAVINQTLTGFDASILVDGKIIGRCEKFSVSIKQNNIEVYEQGTRKAVELKEGKFSVTGEISGYFINYDQLQKALGGNSFAEVLPYCTIQGYLENPEDSSVKGITVQFVKFDGIDLDVPLEGKIEQKCAYKALNVVFS